VGRCCFRRLVAKYRVKAGSDYHFAAFSELSDLFIGFGIVDNVQLCCFYAHFINFKAKKAHMSYANAVL